MLRLFLLAAAGFILLPLGGCLGGKSELNGSDGGDGSGGGVGVPIGPDDDAEVDRTACGGALTSVPERVATEVSADWLYASGTHAFWADQETGRVQEVDLCTGEIRVVAQFEFLTDLAQDGATLLATGTKDGVVGAFRYDNLRDEVVLLSELRRSGQVAAANGRVFVLLEQDTADPESPYGEPHFDLLEVLPDGPVLLHVVEARAPMTSTSLVGASAAGVYVRQDFDCGCNAGLTLYPSDGTDSKGITDSAGSRSIAVQGDRMFLASDLDPQGFGESVVDIVSVPIEDGESKVLFGRDEALTRDVYQIAADERSVCIKPIRTAPRCIDQTSGELRSLSAESNTDSSSLIAMGDGVVAWVSRTETTAELWAAVP